MIIDFFPVSIYSLRERVVFVINQGNIILTLRDLREIPARVVSVVNLCRVVALNRERATVLGIRDHRRLTVPICRYDWQSVLIIFNCR